MEKKKEVPNPGTKEALAQGCKCPVCLVLPERMRALSKHDASGCVIWTGAIAGGGKGYGYFRFEGKSRRAHRVAYEIYHGVKPDVLHHSCLNTRCINPLHLVDGTHAENMLHERGERCESGRHLMVEGNMVGKERRCRACHKEKVRRQRWKKSGQPTPNPGSDDAVWLGCRCARMDNSYGKGYMGISGVFVYSGACSLHEQNIREIHDDETKD